MTSLKCRRAQLVHTSGWPLGVFAVVILPWVLLPFEASIPTHFLAMGFLQGGKDADRS